MKIGPLPTEIFELEEARRNAVPRNKKFVCPLLLRALGRGSTDLPSHRSFNINTPPLMIAPVGLATTLVAITPTATSDVLHIIEINQGLKRRETFKEALQLAVPGICQQCNACRPVVTTHVSEGINTPDNFDSILVIPRLYFPYRNRELT